MAAFSALLRKFLAKLPLAPDNISDIYSAIRFAKAAVTLDQLRSRKTRAIYWARPFTMLSRAKLFALYEAARRIELEGIEGNLVECGVLEWRKRSGCCCCAEVCPQPALLVVRLMARDARTRPMGRHLARRARRKGNCLWSRAKRQVSTFQMAQTEPPEGASNQRMVRANAART